MGTIMRVVYIYCIFVIMAVIISSSYCRIVPLCFHIIATPILTLTHNNIPTAYVLVTIVVIDSHLVFVILVVSSA